MIIVLKPDVTQDQIAHLVERIEEFGLRPHISKGVERTIIGLIGDERVIADLPLDVFPGVERVLPVLAPFKLASREFRPEKTEIKVGGVVIGGKDVVVMAGPCSVEGEEQIIKIARQVKKAGARVLRGGAFKPRTSPYSFQGLGVEGLRYLAQAREETGLPIVTEVMDPRDLESVVRFADIIQIGARNMQNFTLLREVGSVHKPILLKRGMSSTLKELLMSAEYIMSEGNHQIALCERGIRTFSEYTRNTLDISAIPVLAELTHLPIIVDPSHAVGKWRWVESVSLASISAGCDGLLIEVHPNPEQALSDGGQSLKPERFKALMERAAVVARAVERGI
jgi:3-deoxy-7-phosphoheptulonate synthase